MKNRDRGRRPLGGPPPQDFTNQNARLLDDVRVRTGIPLGQQYGLRVVPALQPVFVVEPDAAPLQTFFGTTPVTAALNAGFRSEVCISIAGDRASVYEVYVRILCAPGTSYQILSGLPIAGFTLVATPATDLRYDVSKPPQTAQIVVSMKNTAAATAGGSLFGGFLQHALGGEVRLGPFYLDGAVTGGTAGRGNILVRPTGDATAVAVVFDWRQLQRQPT